MPFAFGIDGEKGPACHEQRHLDHQFKVGDRVLPGSTIARGGGVWGSVEGLDPLLTAP